MAAVTLSEVKTVLQISDTGKDTFITAMIPIVEAWVALNYPYAVLDSTDDDFDASIKLPICKVIAYEMENIAGADTSKIGDISNSYGGYPKSILQAFQPWRKGVTCV